MMSLPTLYLDLDITGNKPSNLISLETHVLNTREVRVIKCKFGKYFADTLQVHVTTDTNGSYLALRGTQYLCVELQDQDTQQYGKEICGAILITDPTIQGTVRLTYQALGGSENADLLAVATTVRDLKFAGQYVPWDSIADKPRRFSPSAHLHDILDMYGMEGLCAAIRRLQYYVPNAGYMRTMDLLDELKKRRRLTSQQLMTSIEDAMEHTRNVGNPHGTTPNQVQLGFVQNRSFVPLFKNGITLEPYASPANALAQIMTFVTADLLRYPIGVANPHRVTKDQVGLSNVQNYGLFSTYSLQQNGQGSMQTQYLNATEPSYLSTISVNAFVFEYGEWYKNANWTDPILSNIVDSNGLVADIDTAVNLANQSLITVQNSINVAGINVLDTTAELLAFEKAQKKYILLNANTYSTVMLREILAHEASRNRLYAVPEKINGLHCWLDFSDSSKLTTLTDGVVPVVGIVVDKSSYVRKYAALKSSTAPRLTINQDASAGVDAFKRTVAKFTNGQQYLDQVEGPAIVLKHGMTLITVVRTGGENTSLSLLSQKGQIGTRPINGMIVAHGAGKNALKIKGSEALSLLTAAPGSSVSNTFTVTVASISKDDASSCWLGTTHPASVNLYPLGHDNLVPARTAEENALVGVELKRIGFNNALFLQEGEIAEYYLYDRQLSLQEVTTLVEYIRLKWNAAMPTAMDLNFVQTAFETLPA